MRLYLHIYLLLPFLLFQTKASTQDYTVQVAHFGTEEGLLHREVNTVFEDRDGFIWIGLEKGLQRFDGHEFKTWTKAGRTGKINHITAIGQDQSGWLWLWNNTAQTFVFLHPETEEELSQSEKFGADFPIKRKWGTSQKGKTGWYDPSPQILTDSKGRLCFTSSDPNELIVYDAAKGFEHFPLPGITDHFIELYFIDRHDQLWVSERKTNSTLHRVNLKGQVLESFAYGKSYDVANFSEWKGDLRYEVSDLQVRRFYGKNKNDQPQKLLEKSWKSIAMRKYFRSTIWEFSEQGIAIYEDEPGAPVLHLKKGDYHKSLVEIIVNVFEDSRGRVWIASRWGLSKVVVKPNRFTNYFSFEKEEEKPFNNSARGIIVGEEMVYANFEFGGLVGIKKDQPHDWSLIFKGDDKHDYFGRPLKFTEGGELMSGHNRLGVQFVDPGSGASHKMTFREQANIDANAFWSFYEDEKKRTWMGMDKGLAVKYPQDDFLQFVPPNELLKKEGSMPVIHQISPAPDGNLFLCSGNQLYLFDPETRTYLSRFGEGETGSNYLPASTFYCLHTDNDGVHWLGTDEGLLRWQLPSPDASTENQADTQASDNYQLFTTRDGLSNEVIYAIFADENNNLWLSSDRGIMRFEKETFRVESFLEKDGIPENEFNRTSAFQEEDGTIYFGGLNGVTSFQPRDFYAVKSAKDFPLKITGYEIFSGKEGQLLDKTGELRKQKSITFRPDDRYFRLSFSLLTFDDVSRILYAWKIEGVDEDWNYQKENHLQIGKLPYGSHTLKIRGQSSGGHWSASELAIEVNVIRPFYLRSWFILFAGAALVAGVFIFIKMRTRRLKQSQQLLEEEILKATGQIQKDKAVIEKQAQELRQLDQVKSRFFANVSHELRTPLTLILGPISSVLKSGELGNRNFTHLKKAQQSGKDLLKLVASILDLSKMESGKLELNENPVLLFPLVRRIASAFESHAQRMGLQFHFEYQAEKSLQLELDREKLETILNNLLSNAMKFTPSGGKVSVKTEDLGNAIHLSVNDTGRGIHPDDLPFVFDRFYQSGQPDAPTEGGTGIGLAFCQELVKIMGGKIWVESALGKGSSFYVEIPRREVLGVVHSSQSPVSSQPEAVGNQQSVVNGQGKAGNSAPSNAQTILVVEDNHSLREYIESILSPFYHIITAENGQVAWDCQLPNAECQLVLSDIMMPVMDGFQLLEKLKSDDRYRHLPVIMLTARADMADRLKALRIGVDDYLLKPFEEEELLARIENLLHNYQERKATLELTDDSPQGVLWTKPKTHPDDAIGTNLISADDQQWLETLEELLTSQVPNSQYSISQLADEMAMSGRQLRRRIKQMTGLTPGQYFKEIRLEHGRRMLEQKRFKTVAQFASAVGFQDVGAFSRNFSQRFGKMPSEYLND